MDWSDVIEEGNLYDAVYLVGVESDDLRATVGTAFSAYYTDRLWTNAHVVEVINSLLTHPQWVTRNPRPYATKTGTLIGESETYTWSEFIIHPDYDGTIHSPDIALLMIDEELPHALPSFLPREMSQELQIGQPLGTLGFPGYRPLRNHYLPLASFRDGTLSSLRPFYNADFDQNPENTGRLVYYNMPLPGGTSGSPVFDSEGFIVAIHHAGISIRITSRGELLFTADTHENFGINVISVWDFIDHLESQRGTGTVAARISAGSGTVSPSQPYPHDTYQPFPDNWNGQTMAP